MSRLRRRARDHLSEGVRSEQNTKVFYRGVSLRTTSAGKFEVTTWTQRWRCAPKRSRAGILSNRTGLASLCVNPSRCLRKATWGGGVSSCASPLAEILVPESRGTKCGLLLPPAMIVVAMSLLAQTSPPPGKPDGHPESSCSVGGRVVSAVDGSPLRSARVTLVPEHDGEKTQIYAATTDSDGRFLLKDLVPGHYHFAANRTGFVTQSYQAKG